METVLRCCTGSPYSSLVTLADRTKTAFWCYMSNDIFVSLCLTRALFGGYLGSF